MGFEAVLRGFLKALAGTLIKAVKQSKESWALAG
jgi:hypothetical protein